MEQEKRLDYLIEYLRIEHDEPISVPNSYATKRELLRTLVNVRPPRPVSEDFLKVQDAFLQEEKLQRGIVQLADIPAYGDDSRLSLWQGDITRLEVDAIVNAANSKLLGCFISGHHCIDNAIHTFAGVQLRQACYEIMQKQGYDESTGTAKITPAYNLPSRYIFHTVGPIVYKELTQKHCDELASCYRLCLEFAAERRLESIALCCISTGEFCFPKQAAAEIAMQTVREFLSHDTGLKRVIFVVFTNADYLIYQNLLSPSLQRSIYK